MKLYKDKYDIEVEKDYLEGKESYRLALSYDYAKNINSNEEFQEYLSSTFKNIIKHIDFNSFKNEMSKDDIQKLDNVLKFSFPENTKIICNCEENSIEVYRNENGEEITENEYKEIVNELKQYHYFGAFSSEIDAVNKVLEKHIPMDFQAKEISNYVFEIINERFFNQNEEKNYHTIFEWYSNHKYNKVRVVKEQAEEPYKIKFVSFTLDEDNYFSIPHEDKTFYSFKTYSEFKEKLTDILSDEEKFEDFLREVTPEDDLENFGFETNNEFEDSAE